jgi:Tfp pilus assembly protein PilF
MRLARAALPGVALGCYMEVAVNTSLPRSFLFIVLGAALLATGGCADQITFSNDSRAEGERLMANKDYTAAAGAFRNAVRQEPRDFRSHYYLGMCYEETAQPQLAIKCYKTALDVYGARSGVAGGSEDREYHARMLDRLARCVAASDPRDVELNALEAQAKAQPTSERLLILARIYRLRNDPDSALPRYNSAIIYGKENFQAFKEYGLYLLELGSVTQSRIQLDDAALQLRRAYALNAEDEEVNTGLRRLGKIPGPSMKDQSQLAKPTVPKGPLPEIKIGGGASANSPVAPRD